MSNWYDFLFTDQDNAAKQLTLAKLQRSKAAMDAQSRLYGGPDSSGDGINWNPLKDPGPNPMATVMGQGDTPQRVPMTTEGLMGAGIPNGQAQSLMNTGPEDFQALRKRLAMQAYPDMAEAQTQNEFFPAPHKFAFGTPGSQLIDETTGKPIGSPVPASPLGPQTVVAKANADYKAGLITLQELQTIVRNETAGKTDNEPLVQIPDPSDPTKGMWVPRSQAIGKNSFQTPRDRMPKMQTYWGDDGSFQQLDSNDPEDQKTIKEQGLVSTAPTDTQRAARGFLDRMVAAEGTIDTILKDNPNFDPANIKDAAAAAILPGSVGQSTPYQQFWQAASDWYRAKLRKESGAVIGDNEMKDEVKTYFPVLSNAPETISQKHKSREQARRQMATGAGVLGRSALKELDAAKSPNPAVKTPITPQQIVDELKRRGAVK